MLRSVLKVSALPRMPLGMRQLATVEELLDKIDDSFLYQTPPSRVKLCQAIQLAENRDEIKTVLATLHRFPTTSRMPNVFVADTMVERLCTLQQTDLLKSVLTKYPLCKKQYNLFPSIAAYHHAMEYLSARGAHKATVECFYQIVRDRHQAPTVKSMSLLAASALKLETKQQLAKAVDVFEAALLDGIASTTRSRIAIAYIAMNVNRQPEGRTIFEKIDSSCVTPELNDLYLNLKLMIHASKHEWSEVYDIVSNQKSVSPEFAVAIDFIQTWTNPHKRREELNKLKSILEDKAISIKSASLHKISLPEDTELQDYQDIKMCIFEYQEQPETTET